MWNFGIDYKWTGWRQFMFDATQNFLDTISHFLLNVNLRVLTPVENVCFFGDIANCKNIYFFVFIYRYLMYNWHVARSFVRSGELHFKFKNQTLKKRIKIKVAKKIILGTMLHHISLPKLYVGEAMSGSNM